jgi:hypothetical protein
MSQRSKYSARLSKKGKIVKKSGDKIKDSSSPIGDNRSIRSGGGPNPFVLS